MGSLDQIIYRAPGDPGDMIVQAGTSLTDPAAGDRWVLRLEPWLRAGGSHGRGYLHSDKMAALVRWHSNAAERNDWQFAHVLVAMRDVLTWRYALLVPDLPSEPNLPSGSFRLSALEASRVRLREPGEIERNAQSAEAIDLLVPLLARALAGEGNITVPWQQRPLADAIIWGLLGILEMLGDTRPVSFLTSVSGQIPQASGLVVSFRRGAARLPPDPGFETLAQGLATSYADDPAELSRKLREHGLPHESDRAGRIALLLDLWPRPGLAAARDRPATHDRIPAQWAAHPETVNSQPATGGNQVICPICLTPIDNWDSLPRYRWDPQQEVFGELNIPAGVTGPLKIDMELGSSRRCPDTFSVMPDNEHYLPADYANFGTPVILGFVGLTGSGKTHLLTAMVGAMQAGLRHYGITSRALDPALHKRFEEERLRPLLNKNEVLPGTPEGLVTFADAFLMQNGKEKPRPVVLFDVAGGDLADLEKRRKFFGIADGLFFIVDPSQIEADGIGDATFNNVLYLLKLYGRLENQVSAAIILNKADLVRFDDPVTRWLRMDGVALDADEFLLESRDVYAYLYTRNAESWTAPYKECAKATLHVASPTGGVGESEGAGAVFPRGVAPRRVLRPMVAMLAMTGVLAGPEAEKVGI
jgi:hypothetical protein